MSYYQTENKKTKFLINLGYFFGIAAIIYFFIQYVFFWILPFLISFAICFLLEPIIQILIRHIHCKRSTAAVISVLTFYILSAVLITIISGTIIKEGKQLLESIPSYLNNITQFLQNLSLRWENLFDNIPWNVAKNATSVFSDNNLSTLLSGTFGQKILSYATQMITSLPDMLLYTVVTVASTFFLAVSFDTVKNFLLSQCKEKTREIIHNVKIHLFATLKNYARAYTILMSVTFIELLGAFYLFGIQPALTLAFFIALIDVLPVLGVGTILIPWSIFELLLRQPIKALILIGIYLFITLTRQILEPKVVGDQVGLPPIVTLFSMYIGLRLFGLVGLFLAPITVIILNNLQLGGKIKIWKQPTK